MHHWLYTQLFNLFKNGRSMIFYGDFSPRIINDHTSELRTNVLGPGLSVTSWQVRERAKSALVTVEIFLYFP